MTISPSEPSIRGPTSGKEKAVSLDQGSSPTSCGSGRDAEGDWKKVVVDAKVTSTDKLNEAFKEKDCKYREWATRKRGRKKWPRQ